MDVATRNLFDFIERFTLDESKTRESMAFWRKEDPDLQNLIAVLKKKAASYSALAQVFAGFQLNSFALPIAEDVDRFYDMYWPYANVKAEFESILNDVAVIKHF